MSNQTENKMNVLSGICAAPMIDGILDADSFVGVDFSARTNERSREYER